MRSILINVAAIVALTAGAQAQPMPPPVKEPAKQEEGKNGKQPPPAQPARPTPRPAPPAAPMPRPTLALTGATVHDGAGKVIPAAVILLKDDKVLAVGPAAAVKVPEGVPTVDLTGKVVIPGLVDARSRLFLANSRDAQGSGEASKMSEGLDLFDRRAAAALAQGVTSVHVAPAGGQFAGLGVLVKLVPEGERSGRVAIEKAALAATYVVRSGSSATPGRYLAVQDKLKERFEEAQDHKEAWDKYKKSLEKYKKDLAEWEKRQKAAAPRPPEAAKQPPAKEPEKGKEPPKPPAKEPEKGKEAEKGAAPAAKKPDAKPTEPKEPKKDEALDALAEVLAGKRALLLRVTAEEDIESALNLAKEFKVKLTLDLATEAWKLAERIRKESHRVLLAPPQGPDARDVGDLHRVADAAARLEREGVEVAIASDGDDARESRHTLFFASRAAAHGLAPARAVQAVTLFAARAVGVESRVGSLEAGKDADLVVLSGPPTSLRARVEQVYIEGRLVHRSMP